MSKTKQFEILKNSKYESTILEWRNDEITRKNSINQEIVTKDDHKKWLSNQLSKNETILIMHFYNSLPAGLIKLDYLQNNNYGISINLNPKFRGMKLSSQFIKESLHFLIENEKKESLNVLASIKPHNIPSIKTFTNCGFTLKDAKYQNDLQLFSINLIKTNNVLLLGYPKNENPLIDFLTSKKFNVQNTHKKLDIKSLAEYDLVISYGYRHILSEKQLSYCKQDPLNLHISLLPWNRGAHPNFWAFYDKTPHGVSIHKIDRGVDTGEILIQKEVFFDGDITLKDSYFKLRLEIEKLFISNYKNLIYKTMKPFRVDIEGSFHLSSQLPDNIDWNKSIAENQN